MPKPRDAAVIDWLLKGDPAIRWQVLGELLHAPRREVTAAQRLVATSGWGAKVLAAQRPDGHWGRGAYQPKWTCTTYTVQLLRAFGVAPGHRAAVEGCRRLLDDGLRQEDGGIDFSTRRNQAETCISSMVLSGVAWFVPEEPRAAALTRYVLREQRADGGWNCQTQARHSSFHTTILALEALRDLGRGRSDAMRRGREFLLAHRLFRSHTTGAISDPKLLPFAFPGWWHYDVLRALDLFATTQAPWDSRLDEAFELVERARRPDGRWRRQHRYAGAEHVILEPGPGPSRWITLRALRVLAWRESARA
jgi:hypothetical protein